MVRDDTTGPIVQVRRRVRAGAEQIFDLWTKPDLMVRWMSPYPGVVERHRKGRDHILSINARSLDEADGWIERMRRYWEERLDAMERLLRELEQDHELGPGDRKHGSR